MLITEAPGVVTLRPDQTKLFLALALDNHSEPGWVSTQLDATISELALALFGPNGRLVAGADAQQLKNEAYAEYRRG